MNAPRSLSELWTGVQHGLSIDAYHGMEGASKTVLDSVAKSPAIAYARHLDPNRPPAEQKGGQLEGELAHCAILEPDEFSKRYAVGPDVIRSTKAWKEFEASNAGKTCIKPGEYEAAMRQGESVRRLPEIRDALAAGHPEVSAFWIDPETGVKCRCRPDWVHPCGDAGSILLDVKTYSDASPAEFRRQVARKRYHVQDAFYSDGFQRASGLEVLAFVFVAVETEWPYAANALMLDDLAKTTGRDLYRRDLDTYAECLRTGEWPGYSNQIEIISLPNWAISNLTEE